MKLLASSGAFWWNGRPPAISCSHTRRHVKCTRKKDYSHLFYIYINFGVQETCSVDFEKLFLSSIFNRLREATQPQIELIKSWYGYFWVDYESTKSLLLIKLTY